jgi:hypothetical protein
MATLHAMALAVVVTALTGSAFAQGKAASVPAAMTPAAPSPRATPQAAPPATAQTPVAPPAAAPMVTTEGQRAPRGTPADTPSLRVMTPLEQEQYRQDLQRAKTGDECRAVVARQRELAAKRAMERGQPAPNNPGSDPCIGR